jgi:hypothetical protein
VLVFNVNFITMSFLPTLNIKDFMNIIPPMIIILLVGAIFLSISRSFSSRHTILVNRKQTNSDIIREFQITVSPGLVDEQWLKDDLHIYDASNADITATTARHYENGVLYIGMVGGENIVTRIDLGAAEPRKVVVYPTIISFAPSGEFRKHIRQWLIEQSQPGSFVVVRTSQDFYFCERKNADILGQDGEDKSFVCSKNLNIKNQAIGDIIMGTHPEGYPLISIGERQVVLTEADFSNIPLFASGNVRNTSLGNDMHSFAFIDANGRVVQRDDSHKRQISFLDQDAPKTI